MGGYNKQYPFRYDKPKSWSYASGRVAQVSIAIILSMECMYGLSIQIPQQLRLSVINVCVDIN